MLSYLTDFEWYRCPEGFRVVEEGAWGYRDDPEDPDRDGEPAPKTDVIVANANKRQVHYPTKITKDLYVVFSKVRTPEDLLAFVNQYGPLTETGFATGTSMDDGASIAELLDEANTFRELLIHQRGGPRQLTHYFKRVSDGWWGRPFECNFVIEAHPKYGIRLNIKAQDLIDALWLQLTQHLAGGVITPQCSHCGEFFAAGAAAGKRKGSKFCCPEHRVKFHSLERSRRK